LREVQDLKADNEVLRQNRASLVDRTKADGSLSEDREKSWKEERVSICSLRRDYVERDELNSCLGSITIRLDSR
jgi:hypothetical protein